VDDASEAGGALRRHRIACGGSSIHNSRCTIFGTGNSVTGTGNTLTLTVVIHFSPLFNGNQVFYLAARNNAANSDWQAAGSVTIH
jgi:hypothetical protein